LEASLEQYGRTHSKEDLWQLIVSRKAFFWPGDTCALVGDIWRHPSGLKSGNGWLR
jgi:hypothetical protein